MVVFCCLWQIDSSFLLQIINVLLLGNVYYFRFVLFYGLFLIDGDIMGCYWFGARLNIVMPSVCWADLGLPNVICLVLTSEWPYTRYIVTLHLLTWEERILALWYGSFIDFETSFKFHLPQCRVTHGTHKLCHFISKSTNILILFCNNYLRI